MQRKTSSATSHIIGFIKLEGKSFIHLSVTSDGKWSVLAVLLKHRSSRGTDWQWAQCSSIKSDRMDRYWLGLLGRCPHLRTSDKDSTLFLLVAFYCCAVRLRGRIPEHSWPAMPWERKTSAFPKPTNNDAAATGDAPRDHSNNTHHPHERSLLGCYWRFDDMYMTIFKWQAGFI